MGKLSNPLACRCHSPAVFHLGFPQQPQQLAIHPPDAVSGQPTPVRFERTPQLVHLAPDEHRIINLASFLSYCSYILILPQFYTFAAQ
jgi:hypothetical protein